MTVETINRLIFGASLLSALFALSIVWLNRYKNVLVAAQGAEQRKMIEQLRAQTTTIRSCQVSLSIVASKAAHVMNAEVAPLFPGHALALAIDETSVIRFANGEGNMVDAPDGSNRERGSAIGCLTKRASSVSSWNPSPPTVSWRSTCRT